MVEFLCVKASIPEVAEFLNMRQNGQGAAKKIIIGISGLPFGVAASAASSGLKLPTHAQMAELVGAEPELYSVGAVLSNGNDLFLDSRPLIPQLSKPLVTAELFSQAMAIAEVEGLYIVGDPRAFDARK